LASIVQASVVQIIDTSALFAPLRLKNILLRNRFVVPSMQRGISQDGMPTSELATYYRQRAEGGFALVMSEACAIDHPSAGGEGKVLRMTSFTKDAWRRCVEGVSAEGAHMVIQLWHRGGMREQILSGPGADIPTISPSGLAGRSKSGGRAILPTELSGIKQSYVRSALMAQEIGAAGVEIHGGHGFLLDQFLWSVTNRRTDGYGGDDIAVRVRFPAEVVAAVREAVGEDFLISFRFSQWKQVDYETGQVVQSPEELGIMLNALRMAGVDLFHPSMRRFNRPEWPGSDRSLAGWTRMLSGKPVLAVGSVGGNCDLQSLYDGAQRAVQAEGESTVDIVRSSLAEVMKCHSRGDFDLVAVGRASIGDPEWVNKIAAGRYEDIRRFELDDLLSIISAYNNRVKQRQNPAN
jgi:2,4-dienoyl-CoA reductase-like NADH-dependent reductase (Old Yellow Enzyme family)